MVDEPLEEVYFNWLYSKVASVDVPTPSLTYVKLLRLLHSVEFVWLLSGDDNRKEDGLEIRHEFLNQSRMDQDPSWTLLGCSTLEMLIAFSRRTEWENDDISAREWFWIFLTHLGLNELNDAQGNFEHYVRDILQTFIWRTYDRTGHGGMFPLHDTNNDQREIEIWYQFCEWMVEQGMA